MHKQNFNEIIGKILNLYVSTYINNTQKAKNVTNCKH